MVDSSGWMSSHHADHMRYGRSSQLTGSEILQCIATLFHATTVSITTALRSIENFQPINRQKLMEINQLTSISRRIQLLVAVIFCKPKQSDDDKAVHKLYT